jgi:hypothetical protein
VPGKRLFWFSIIIVELVLVYLLWRPYREHFTRASHRAAPPPAVVQRAENKRSPIVIEPKPLKITHSPVQHRRRSVVVNAALRSPEPIPAKPSVPASILSPLDSFWCRISQMDSTCDCKNKNEEHAANLVTP